MKITVPTKTIQEGILFLKVPDYEGDYIVVKYSEDMTEVEIEVSDG